MVPLIDLGSAAGTGRYPRLAHELESVPITGPDSGTDREIAQFFATFEHRFNKTWTVRAAGSYYHRHYWTYSAGGGNLNPATGLIRKGEPGFGKIDEDGGGFGAGRGLPGPSRAGRRRHDRLGYRRLPLPRRLSG